MKRAAKSLGIAGAVFAVATACGIDEEIHNKALDDLAKTQGKHQSCEEAKAAMEKDLTGKITELEDTLGAQTDQTKKVKSTLASTKMNLEATEANLEATQEELTELRKQRAAAEKRIAAFKKLNDRLKQLVDTGKLKVKFRKGQMTLELPSGVLFPSGKSKLKKSAKDGLEEVANILLEFKDRRFMVAGHTDNQKIKTKKFPSNWHLSSARAVSIVEFLIDKGFDPANLGAGGFGEHDPVADNESKEGRELNRRIEIILVPDLSELPTLAEEPT